MKITREDVLRVAELAHLELADAEVDTFRGQLDSILEYVEKLNQLDTAGVEPMAGGRPTGVAGGPSGISNLKSEIARAGVISSASGISNLKSETSEEAGLREDVPWPSPPIDPAEALRAAPDPGPGAEGPFVRVPKVVERG